MTHTHTDNDVIKLILRLPVYKNVITYRVENNK